jgi:TonB family protein
MLALLAQLATVGVILLVSNLPFGEVAPKRPSAVSIAPISSAEWERNRATTDSKQARPTERKEAKKEPEDRKDPEGQVVATPRGNDEVPDDAKYVAESNNRVEKETRSSKATPFYRNPSAKVSGPQPQAQANAPAPSDEAPAGAPNAKPNPSQPRSGQAARKTEIPSVKRQDEVAMRDTRGDTSSDPEVANRTGTEAIRGNSDRLNPGTQSAPSEAESGGTERRGAGGRLILTPTADVLSQLDGAPANDHLEDVEEGEGTFLNTRDWKYASFFNRVKQFVGMHWDPQGPLQQRDPTGQIYSGRDRHTVLEVTLNETGQLEDVRIEKSSGLDFLDQVAVQSFERASPFPNPPAGLLDDDHKVRFSFGFFLDMSSSGRLQLFRRQY